MTLEYDLTPIYQLPLPTDQSRISALPWYMRALSRTLEDKLPASLVRTARDYFPSEVARQASSTLATASRALSQATAAVAAAKNAQDRVAGLESAAGFGPSTPADGTVADLISAPGTLTADALSKALAKLETLMTLERFGGVADGATDDTSALLAGLTVSAETGLPLRLPYKKTIRVSGQIVPPPGSKLHGNGATLDWATTTPSGTWLMNLNRTKSVTVEELTLRVDTSTNLDQRGLTCVDSDDVAVHGVTVYATTPGTGWDSNFKLGFLFENTTNLRVSRLSSSGFDNAFRFKKCTGVRPTGITSIKYRLGLWVSDCQRAHFTDGFMSGKGPNSDQGDGNSGVLIDASAAGACAGITLEDFEVQDSGATGFRLGGQNPIYDVNHVRCRSIRAGSNGFKTLGGTVASGSRHQRIRYTDCLVVDAGQGGGTNCAALAVHLSEDVVVTNLIVRPGTPTGYSCREGVYIAGASRVSVCNAQIDRPTVAAVAIRAALGDVADVTIHGGRFSTINGAHAFELDWRGATFRRIQVTGYPALEHYGAGFLLNAVSDATSSISGSISLSWKTSSPNAVKNVATGSGAAAVVVDMQGLVPSDLSFANISDGSRWWALGAARLGLKKGGAWTWQ